MDVRVVGKGTIDPMVVVAMRLHQYYVELGAWKPPIE